VNHIDRRRFLQALAGMGALELALPARMRGAWAQVAAVETRPSFSADPFSLGVASGYPSPDGMVLWTRLAPEPLANGGGMGRNAVEVKWEIAEDDAMSRIVATGTERAEAAWGHSVHVEVRGLQPGRPYWYRFNAGDAVSTVGRTRTAPAANTQADRLRFAFASCQHYEQGFYGAYRHMVKDDPDLVVFLGDYIYEGNSSRGQVRSHNMQRPNTLADYRARYALYKSDPALQAAHAVAPWLVTWDDHEVGNDYAGDQAGNNEPAEKFMARRAIAYKAYYEHMPLPRRALPNGPNALLYASAAFGTLVSFHMLDDRQYRSAQACPRAGRRGSNTVDIAQCAELEDKSRTLLGAEQHQWIESQLSASRTRWNILGQQSVMAQIDIKSGPGRSAWTDAWDGYPHSRQRLLDFIAARKVANPVVIGGDVHMSYVNDLKTNFDDHRSPVIASEFVGTSISSIHPTPDNMQRRVTENAHIHLAEARYRGYTRVELTPRQMKVDLRAMENTTQPDAACSTFASFVVEDGRAGPQKA
jgi:alkaline phosphatase D